MNKKMKFRKGSVWQYILEHLFNSGAVYHKEIVLILGDRWNKQTIWKALRDLEERKFIGIKNSEKRDSRKIYLSKKGLECLQSKDEYYYFNEHLKIPYWGTQNEKGEKESQVRTVIVGSDIICYPKYKPSLRVAAQIINTRSTDNLGICEEGYWEPDDLKEFSQRFNNGIYYSSAEVRNALKDSIGAEQIYRSRFNGIIMTPDKLYIIYHVQEGLIKINKPSEATLIDSLITFFSNYRPYSVDGLPSCIAMGTISNEIGIPTMVTGFKNGEIVNKESLDNLNAQEAMNFLKANVKIFDEMFYIPINKTGVTLLKSIVLSTKSSREEDDAKWINTTPGYISVPDKKSSGYSVDKESNVNIVMYGELKKILSIRNDAYATRIVTRPDLAEGISKAVGPNVIDMVDFKNQPISMNYYDIYGIQKGVINDNYRKEKHKCFSSYSLHCSLPPDIMHQLKSDAMKRNITPQQIIIQILKNHYNM